MDFKDTNEFKMGRRGERIVARLLQRIGYFIVPSYDYSGEDGKKAPLMHGLNLSLVIPDLDVSKAGYRCWIEVKTKQEATLHRNTGVYEHGFSLRHYTHYLRVQEETGTPVWVFVVEEAEGIVLVGRLSYLKQFARQYNGTKMGGEPMMFFPRDRFKALEIPPVISAYIKRRPPSG